jgi:DNA repair protein RadC
MAVKPSGDRTGREQAPPHYYGHRERLRARFREAGSDAVTDYELLELALFRALPRCDIKPLAKSLIGKFGSFAETIAASPQRLAEVAGLGDAAITELKVVEAAAHRLARGEVKRRWSMVGGSALIANTMWRGPCRAAARAHLRPVRADALSACSDLRR